MDDELVKRLREWPGKRGTGPLSCTMDEAADRIEQLEAALRKIIDRAEHRMGHAVSDDVCVIARAALAGEKKDD